MVLYQLGINANNKTQTNRKCRAIHVQNNDIRAKHILVVCYGYTYTNVASNMLPGMQRVCTSI